MTIGCVILAGGESSRMGTEKALLPIGNENFINRLCDTFSFMEEKIIAKGEREIPVEGDWKAIADIYPHHGPIGGLHAALFYCQSEALFLTACDTPLLERAIYDKLREELTEDTDAVIAITEDGRCHPLCGIYQKRVRGVLQEQILADKNKMMWILKKIRTKYVETDSKIYGLYNINTPEEFAEYIG